MASQANGGDLSTALDKQVRTHPRSPGRSLPTPSPELPSLPRAQLDEEALSDLSYAFVAIDLDHSGTLDASELLQLLRVLGDDDSISLKLCQKLIAEANVRPRPRAVVCVCARACVCVRARVCVRACLPCGSVCARARASPKRLAPPPASCDRTACFLCIQSQFKEWRAANNLTQFLPDEYQYLLWPLYMEYLYVEFVCKCIYVYFTYILAGAGTLGMRLMSTLP